MIVLSALLYPYAILDVQGNACGEPAVEESLKYRRVHVKRKRIPVQWVGGWLFARRTIIVSTICRPRKDGQIWHL
jgi:hypothetical protein